MIRQEHFEPRNRLFLSATHLPEAHTREAGAERKRLQAAGEPKWPQQGIEQFASERQKPPRSFDPARNARMRAIVVEAVDAVPGATYVQIREWIRENKRFEMENVGARVRELATDKKYTHFCFIRYDSKGKAHVYPIKKPIKETSR